MNHIDSYPKYVSHYCRQQTQQKYLPSNLNKKIMYRDYAQKTNNAVSYWTYSRLFKKQNLKFKVPNKDTCASCDAFEMQIKIARDEVSKNQLKIQKELHQRKAEQGYQLKRQSKDISATDSTKRVLVFDLEQCLPTPHLKSSQVYFARQLYVYNLTIYDTKTKLTHCYMWHEGESTRGANQIASCIFKDIMDEIPDEVTEIRLFSDSCTGQNRNSIVAAMFFVLLQEKPTIKTIDHIFLVPGHTRLECDNKHSVIEKSKKTVERIEIPDEWYQLVDKAGRTDTDKYPDGKFKVVKMCGNIYNFGDLLKKPSPLVKRECDEEGERFYYLDSFWFRYSRSQKNYLLVKPSFNEDSAFQRVNFQRTKRNSDCRLSSFLKKLPTSVPIAEKKKKDLLDLLRFVSEQHHSFYENLKTSPDVLANIDPDLPSEHEDDNFE